MKITYGDREPGMMVIALWDDRRVVGMINIHQSRRGGLHGWEVAQVDVLRTLTRRGYGTILYDTALEYACAHGGGALFSSYNYALSSMSRGWWRKQCASGRAHRVRQRDGELFYLIRC